MFVYPKGSKSEEEVDSTEEKARGQISPADANKLISLSAPPPPFSRDLFYKLDNDEDILSCLRRFQNQV